MKTFTKPEVLPAEAKGKSRSEVLADIDSRLSGIRRLLTIHYTQALRAVPGSVETYTRLLDQETKLVQLQAKILGYLETEKNAPPQMSFYIGMPRVESGEQDRPKPKPVEIARVK